MTPGDARTPGERVREIREGYEEHVQRCSGYDCEWYGCRTVGELLGALASLERQVGERTQRNAMDDDTRDLLAEIVAAWEESEHHDVPLALIQRARALLRAKGGGTP